MKSRKIYQTTLHDLHDMDPANFAVSRVSREFAPPEVGNLRIVTPGVGAVADDIARSSEPAGARRDAL